MKSIPLLVCLASSLALADPIGGATGNYENDLGQVLGAAKGIAAMRNTCNDKLPAFASQNNVAFQAWEDRNRATLQEVNMRWQHLLAEVSEGSKEREVEIIARLQHETRQAEVALRAHVDRLPQQRIESICAALPSNLASPQRDLEESMKHQLRSIREHQSLVQ